MISSYKPKNILIWLRSTEEHALSQFQSRKAVAYHKFFKTLNERDVLRFAYDFDSYKGNATFSPVSLYKDGKIIPSDESFTADVIYQFKNLAPINFDPGNAVITNTPAFREFCAKFTVYSYMPEFFPLTYFAKNNEEILEAVSKIQTKKVVFKPNRGQNGDDVFIFDIDAINLDLIPKERLENQGFLIQEFIDTSAGIPGIVSSYHDLRISTHGNKISLCHVRQPEAGSLIGNSHRGASITEIDIDTLPPYILDFYKQVHNKIIQTHPHPIYSMDIGVGKEGPKLIELNPHTSFPGNDFRCMDRFINNFVDHLETIAQKN